MNPTVINLKPSCLVLLGSIYTTPDNKVCTVTRRRYYSTSYSDSQLPTPVPILTINNLNNEDSIKNHKELLKYKGGIYSFINWFSLDCILFFAYYSLLLFNPSPSELGTRFYSSNSQSSGLQPNMKQNNNSKGSLVPWFITGFADAEATFSASLAKNDKSRLGWRILVAFSIHLHKKDEELLNLIQL